MRFEEAEKPAGRQQGRPKQQGKRNYRFRMGA
jgi:hypothetical protein